VDHIGQEKAFQRARLIHWRVSKSFYRIARKKLMYSKFKLLLQYKTQTYLLILTFITAIGTYFVIPFLSIYMTKTLGITGGVVGIVLSIQLFFSRGLMIITGPLSDHVGSKYLSIIGLFLIGVSYLAYAIIQQVWLFVIFLAIGGLGVALFQPSSKAILVTGIQSEIRNILFGWRNVLFNSGVALGSGLGLFLVDIVGYKTLFIFGSLIFIIMAAISIFIIPTSKYTSTTHASIFKNVIEAFSNIKMLLMFICSIVFWFLYTQVTITVPLTFETYNMVKLLSLFFMLNAALAIIIQVPILNYTNKLNLSPENQFVLGILLIGLGLVSLVFLPYGLGIFILFLVTFTLGEILSSPNLDAIASLLANKDNQGTYFGVLGAGWAIGGTLGNIIGGFLFDYNITIMWVIFSLVSLVFAFIIKTLFTVINKGDM
jgi:MFS transporter, DHA1 family, multidrug resistance protein